MGTRENAREKHIGEKRMMKCGMEAEVIEYRNHRDIDVRFTDGTVREHIAYDNYKNCKISNPNLANSRFLPVGGYRNERIGEKRMMKCGLEAEIIAYRNASDIDVRFPDSGLVRKHRGYRDFLNGGILPASDRSSIRVGEKKTMHDGSIAEITEYRKYSDVDVLFDSGARLSHVQYRHFSNGKLRDPNRTREKRNHIGETVRQHCGLDATITGQHEGGKVDVIFSDGSERKRVQYGDFRKGHIGKIEIPSRTRKDRIGKKKLMKCGLEAEIIGYQSSVDIDILFSNGEKLKHQKYSSFQSGDIHPDNVNHHDVKIGDKATANNGQTMTLVEYRTSKDVDVEFEDGTVVKNKSVYSFLDGSIENPNAPYGKQRWRIGMIGQANNGLRMKIIGRLNRTTVRIKFESGHERDILTNNFRLGRANVLDENGNVCLSRSPNKKGIFLDYETQFAYEENGLLWYKTIDLKTSERSIMTPQMMMEKRGVKPLF